MRKLIFSLGVLSLLVSCGKDEPVLRISPSVKEVPVNKNEENAGEADKEVVGEGEKTENENNPTGESGDEKDATAKDVKEEVKVDLELDELIIYFAFDKNKDVNEAQKAIEKIKGVKDINGKKVDITEASLTNMDDAVGSFRLHVKGTINQVNFQKDFDLNGFKKAEVKLEDFQIAKRGYGQWKVGKDVYLKEFKFDDLFIHNKVNEFTVDYLKKYVAFYASKQDGIRRQLTDQELSKLNIVDLKYSNGAITFRTAYNKVVSDVITSLSFDKNEFYGMKMHITNDFAKDKYMRGVYENLSYYYQLALDYDKKVYVAYLDANNRNRNDQSNSLMFYTELQDQKTEKELGQILNEIKGFKKLSDLKDDLIVTSSYDLAKSLKEKLSKISDENVKNYLQAIVKKWTRSLKFHIKRNGENRELFWDDASMVIQGHNNFTNDVYLENPIFEVISATFTDKDLDIKLKLVAVNDVALSDVVFNIKVHNVK
ncbi:hypothetical protein [Porphyromonas pogonae]|uniref:hypothetical protein n=1 Tax=Porphyromonas pogonae TaxID=867595 RepID=UPI002E79D561|nr:hypothetical protein [Porphyromonas pogonae]